MAIFSYSNTIMDAVLVTLVVVTCLTCWSPVKSLPAVSNNGSQEIPKLDTQIPLFGMEFGPVWKELHLTTAATKMVRQTLR